MAKKIAFIVNPIAGANRKRNMIELIKNTMPEGSNYEILLWEKLDMYDSLIQRVFDDGFDVCVAVGGDGTVNRIATSLMMTNVTMGIIPTGSGNGLARHLKIPMKAEEAILFITTGKETTIDGASINGKNFFCTSGAGFDAHVGYLFSKSKTRGITSYIKIILKNLLSYKPEFYTLSADENTFEDRAYMITIANANQYGNNAFIAPHADISDGYLDVCIMLPHHIWHIPFIGMKIMNGSIQKSAHYKTFKTKKLTLKRAATAAVHYDGEPDMMSEELNIEIIPSALKVMSRI